MNTEQTVKRYQTDVPLADFLAACVDIPRFAACCQACPNYDARWSCPSFGFDPMEVWRRYHTLRLMARVFPLPPDTPQQEALAMLEREKQAFLRELLEAERQLPGALALSAGTCLLCDPCPRASGQPCRHPEQMRYSIEALGGDAVLAAKRYFEINIQWAEGGRAPAYLTLVGGLLTPKEGTAP